MRDEAKFCEKCGKTVADCPPATGRAPKAKSKKKWIIWSVVLAIAVYCFVCYGLPFIINTPERLTKKLEGTDWYSEPASFVTVTTGERFDAAYSLEFFDDGTAIKTSYACYGEKGDYYKVEIVERKTVSWSVEKSSVLVLDDAEYSYRFLKDMDTNWLWYIDDDELVVGRTYYPRDKWGYSEGN